MSETLTALRDEILQAALPHIPFDGWTNRAMRAGARDVGRAAADAERAFPYGAADMIAHYSDLADRQMVAEMERRYRLMAAMGVRNIAGYNKKVKDAIKAGEPIKDPLFKVEPDPISGDLPEVPDLTSLPYIVVVVDEFADMIMVVGKKVEELIARLAQKARAAGIHLLLLGVNAMAIEEPSYSVLETEGNFELRKYSSYIVAETYVEGDFEAVGSEGFRRLADYIGGKNRKKESISMTAPVSQKPASEKIAMTAPVSQARDNHRWRIAFIMPSAYTMDTLPTPDDDRIALREEKEKTVAVIRYSGTWGKKRYMDHETKLVDWISEKAWKIISEPIWA